MKIRKIILLTAIVGGFFYSAPAWAEQAEKFCPACQDTQYCGQKTNYQCVTKKSTNENCDLNSECITNLCVFDYTEDKKLCMNPHPDISCVTGVGCLVLKPNGKPCENSYECKSKFCGTGQGAEQKCIDPPTNAGYLKVQPIAPALEIKIPTLQPFTTQGMEEPDAEGNIYIPFIGQYIVGIYKWALLIAGIVATIMIILGGFTYLTSGGNATRAEEGKERIGAAIFGLVLLLGSYLLLYLLNPGLVEFRSLKIKVIKRLPIESMAFENHEPSTGFPKALEATDYDVTFQAFANCAGIDWRIYKAIAYKESGLNSNATGGKTGDFVGLFQVYQPYCKDVLQKVKWDTYCDSPGLTNPWVNNAFAALLIDKNAANIEGKCPNAPSPDKLTMLYIGHNCGPGALNSLLKTGCDINNWLAAPPNNCSFKKMNFAKNVAGAMAQLGVSNLKTAPENFDITKCPFNSGMPLL